MTPEIYIYNGSLKQMNGQDIMKFVSGDDCPVFLIDGRHGEVYIIEDPDTIKQMEQIAAGQTERKAQMSMLKIMNPDRYGE